MYSQATYFQKLLTCANELYELGEYQLAVDVLSRASELVIKESE